MPGDLVIGIDFAGPATASGQRRKILAVAAERTGTRRFAVRATGFNARLLGAPPGWTAEELAEELVSGPVTPSVVAADFPFCVPRELLARESFAAAVGDHDAADALVALCIAALHREGLAREVLGAPAGARKVEGAIWSVSYSKRQTTRKTASRGEPPPEPGGRR